MEAEKRMSFVMRAVVVLFVIAHLFLLHPPWRFEASTAQLDSSYVQVVAHAAASQWQWGRDIAFTFGPLGFAWNAVYLEPLLARTLLLKSVFTGALAIGVVGILVRAPASWMLPIYALIAFAGSMLASGFYSIIPLLAALNYFCDADDRRLRFVIPLVVVSGLLALSYVPFGVLALLVLLLMDLGRLNERRLPIFVPLLIATALGGFFLDGQSPGMLAGYLRSSFELIAGYSEAMALYDRPYETPIFVALALVSAALIVRCELPSLRDSRLRVQSLLMLACIAIYWFFTFKTGFVRHDYVRSVWSWSALAIGIAAYLSIRKIGLTNNTLTVSMLGLAAIACSVETMVARGGDRVSFVARQAKHVFVDVPLREQAVAYQLVMTNEAWRRAMEMRREFDRIAVRQAYAALRIPGTVDMMGNRQAALLLQDVEYRPRPVFQDFAAYTSWLIELNRAHLRDSRSARTMLLSTETIDNRYPMMDRGLAVIELLAHYRPSRLAAGFLVLHRREAPLEVTLTPPQVQEVAIGQWIDVTASETPIMLAADVRPNAWGRMAVLFYRLPMLELTVRLADGKERSHRFVSGIGRDGLLLSPYIDTVTTYAAMATGTVDATAGSRVVAFKLAALEGAAYFSDRIHVSVRGIRLPAVNEALDAELRRAFDRRRVASRMAGSAVPRNPHLEARDTMLFAHAPVTANLAVSSIHRLQVSYGIGDGAWQNGAATDGVCFHVLAERANSQPVTLHERCLLPVERKEDRGEQRVSLPVDLDGVGMLHFKTDCRGTCDWDWSYWKDIDVTP